jgi:molybdenum cofactor cytidylyltransferase
MGAVAIVPAAGRSARFGALKQLASVDGQPMLERTIRSLLDAEVASVLVVIAPALALDGVPALADPRVRVITNPNPERGMFSSIQTGIVAAEGDPILVLPGDMPFVARDTIAAVLTASRLDAVIVPRHRGHRGHPISIPRRFRDVILESPPTTTLSEVLAAAGARIELDVDDPGILRDVDTPSDLT